MIERIKRISSPLTIIGIFCILAEIAATVTIPLLPVELQRIFIWYVMGFPVILVLLFFITLHLRPQVLYSPSDYSSDKYFLEALLDNNRKTLSEIYKNIENIYSKLKNNDLEYSKSENTNTNYVPNNILIKNELSDISLKIKTTLENPPEFDVPLNMNEISVPYKQKKIIDYLKLYGKQTSEELLAETNFSKNALDSSIIKLMNAGFIKTFEEDGKIKYSLQTNEY